MFTNNSHHCWMSHVASVCTTCCVLLGVFAPSLKPVKLLNQQLPTFLLFRDLRSVALQCCIGLHSSSNIVGAMHAHYTWFTTSYGLQPSHDALQIPTLLGAVSSICTPLPTRTQQLTTMLGVVASVYTSPLVLGLQILVRLYQRCLTSCHLRLLHTRQQFAATRCSDTRQPQISVVENFCENLCLRNRILSP